MTTTPARFYDGHSSRATPVRLLFPAPGRLRIEGLPGEETREYPLDTLEVSPPLGHAPRTIRLPDGGLCEFDPLPAAPANTAPGSAVVTGRGRRTPAIHPLDQALAATRRGRASGWLHRLEAHWHGALLALLVAVAVVWGSVAWGVPWLAEVVADRVPPEVDQRIGRQTLATLERLDLLTPTTLPEERQWALQELFHRAMAREAEGAGAGHHFQLLLRHSEALGANAIALPGGTIVVTDGLLRLGGDERELLGILLHEAGHVVHRHGLRTLLQSTITPLILAAATGDITASGSLLAGLPVVLMERRYSRAFEWQADDYAVKGLVARGVDPHHFARALERLARGEEEARIQHTKKDDTGNGGTPGKPREEKSLPSYLSTHPATAERVAAIRAAAQRAGWQAAPTANGTRPTGPAPRISAPP